LGDARGGNPGGFMKAQKDAEKMRGEGGGKVGGWAGEGAVG